MAGASARTLNWLREEGRTSAVAAAQRWAYMSVVKVSATWRGDAGDAEPHPAAAIRASQAAGQAARRIRRL
jgi:hypothetical protein